jgi:uncharacterized protein (TIGR02117 family)
MLSSLYSIVLFSILLSSYSKAVDTFSLSHQESPKIIYRVEHGWHSGVVMSYDDVAPYLQIKEFKDPVFLEIGWGDATYYPAEDPTFLMGFKALFLPTDSVLHVVAFKSDPYLYFPNSKLTTITLTHQSFINFVKAIDRTFMRDEAGDLIMLKKGGLYGDSRFYKAHGTFHLFNTCNDWSKDIVTQPLKASKLK